MARILLNARRITPRYAYSGWISGLRPATAPCNPSTTRHSVRGGISGPEQLRASSSTLQGISFDVVVVGGGNAGFSAATSAAQAGAKRVLVVDKCPEAWAGGNTFFTAGAYRTVFDGLADIMTVVKGIDRSLASRIDMEPYTEEDFQHDIDRVTAGRADPVLSGVLVRGSRSAIQWLAEIGIPFNLSFHRQAYENTETRRFQFWGGMVLTVVDGGKGLVAAHRKAAAAHGVRVEYGGFTL